MRRGVALDRVMHEHENDVIVIVIVIVKMNSTCDVTMYQIEISR